MGGTEGAEQIPLCAECRLWGQLPKCGPWKTQKTPGQRSLGALNTGRGEEGRRGEREGEGAQRWDEKNKTKQKQHAGESLHLLQLKVLFSPISIIRTYL